MKYKLTASIVAYHNDPDEIAAAADSFLTTPIQDKMLYIIDHSKEDDLKDIFLGKAEVTYAHHPENRGFGAGHNIAIREIVHHSDYHLVLNPDVAFDPGVLPELIGYLDHHADTAVVMPKVLDSHGQVQYLAKLLPHPVDLLFKRFLPGSWVNKRLEKFQLKHSGYDRIMDVPYLSGCFMVLRCAVILEKGMFDERFFMYPEDIDLTRRIHSSYRTVYYPFVHILHRHEASSYKSIKMLWIHIANMVRYFNKWGWFYDPERKQFNKKVLDSIMNQTYINKDFNS